MIKNTIAAIMFIRHLHICQTHYHIKIVIVN